MSFSFINHPKTGFAVKIDTNYQFEKQLAAYNLYDGNLADLIPGPNVEIFELANTLFVDYSEKQRLIRLPEGTALKAQGDDLPIFPEGTVMAKTFYYSKDRRNPELGRNILETRLLVKQGSNWFLGTYKWNKEQTAATLIDTGDEMEADWIDLNGEKQHVSFYIPTKKECSACHLSAGKDIPIGPKLRNLNIMVNKNGNDVNQLQYLINKGWLNNINVNTITALPNWKDTTHTVEDRALAYLDINCAHCHSPKGSSSNNSNLFLNYETPFDDTRIYVKRHSIKWRMATLEEDYRMPLMGTTIIHTEGLKLIKQYIEDLD